MKIKVKEFYPNGTSFYTGWVATIFFITFGNLPKATVNSHKARANLREIPEDVSVRKPPLKRKSAAATDTNARE